MRNSRYKGEIMPEQILGQLVGTTLTNVCVRQRYKNLVKSALLSKVDGVALVYRSYPIWLIAAVVVAVLSAIVTAVADKAKGGVFVAGLVVAGILTAIYFGTRYVVLEI
jgi:glycerol uptake facilitator-like aquaporin